MQLWSPPHDAPHLFEWWRPLVEAGRRVRAARLPWPVHVDEFRLAGRVMRSGRPDIWLYEHHANGGTLCLDHTGRTYTFIPTPRAKGPGRFTPCPLRTALWRAGLPDVVEPVDYRPSRPSRLSAPRAAGVSPWHPAGTGAWPANDDEDEDDDDYGYDEDVRDVIGSGPVGASSSAPGAAAPDGAPGARAGRRHLTLVNGCA